MYWEILPPRPERFPKGRGVQNPRPREISRAEGDVFPNASLLSAVYGYNILRIFRQGNMEMVRFRRCTLGHQRCGTVGDDFMQELSDLWDCPYLPNTWIVTPPSSKNVQGRERRGRNGFNSWTLEHCKVWMMSSFVECLIVAKLMSYS